jgi:secondary thiamine-phosphate synthase enzyme
MSSMLAQHTLQIATSGRGFTDIAARVAECVASSGVSRGLVQAFATHTSCSLLLGENADPAVRADLERWFARAVPDGDPLFRHTAEGPDDMPAHVRSSLAGVSVTLPVSDGALGLGTWQGLYLGEHRHDPHRRNVLVTVLGAP